MAGTNSSNLNILNLTWNMNGLSICRETQQLNVNGPQHISNLKKAYHSRINKGQNCIIAGATIVNEGIRPYLNRGSIEDTIHVIHISTQEEAYSGSYLHSDILPDKLGEEGYYLFKKFKADVGESQSGGKNQLNNRGALRVSTYIHESYINFFREGERHLNQAVAKTYIDKSNSQQNQFPFISRHGNLTYGGICTYLFSPKHGMIVFLDVDFPRGNSAFLDKMANGFGYIQRALYDKITINNMLEYFIHKAFPSAKYIFLMGEIKTPSFQGRRGDKFSSLEKDLSSENCLGLYPFSGGNIKWHRVGDGESEIHPNYPIKPVPNPADCRGGNGFNGNEDCYWGEEAHANNAKIVHMLNIPQGAQNHSIFKCEKYMSLYSPTFATSHNAPILGLYSVKKGNPTPVEGSGIKLGKEMEEGGSSAKEKNELAMERRNKSKIYQTIS